MSVHRQGRKHGGDRKHGRHKRKPANQRYVRENRLFKNKRKRVRQSNGEKFARAWERKYAKIYQERAGRSFRNSPIH